MMLSKNVVKIALAVLIVVILFRMLSAPRQPENYGEYDPSALTYESVVPLTSPGPTTQMTTSKPTVVGTMPPMSTSVDLLPKPVAPGGSEYGEFAPSNALGGQNFIDATKLIGIDTQGSSMKNANWSLRHDPPIPRGNTGPWNSSVIEADLLRKPLDC